MVGFSADFPLTESLRGTSNIPTVSRVSKSKTSIDILGFLGSLNTNSEVFLSLPDIQIIMTQLQMNESIKTTFKIEEARVFRYDILPALKERGFPLKEDDISVFNSSPQ